MNIDFNFIKININNRNLTYTYKQQFSAGLNEKSFEYKVNL